MYFSKGWRHPGPCFSKGEGQASWSYSFPCSWNKCLLGFASLNQRGDFIIWQHQTSNFSIKKAFKLQTSNQQTKTRRFDYHSHHHLTSVNMDANGDEKDGDEAEVDDGMDQNRRPACMHASELHHPVFSRNLKQQPRRQQHEQHHRYQHRSPIRHYWLCFKKKALCFEKEEGFEWRRCLSNLNITQMEKGVRIEASRQMLICIRTCRLLGIWLQRLWSSWNLKKKLKNKNGHQSLSLYLDWWGLRRLSYQEYGPPQAQR